MVKFGQRIIEESANFTAAVELSEAFNYKQFKKFLTCCRECPASAMSCAKEAQAAAEARLIDPFWKWPQDAQEISGDIAGAHAGRIWFERLFENKLIAEAHRIRTTIGVIQKRVEDEKAHLASLRPAGHLESAQEHLKLMIDLRSKLDTLDQQLDSYTTLNYSAFYKIIKKFEKARDVFDDSNFLLRLMPTLDDILFGCRRLGGDENADARAKRYMSKLESIYDDMNGNISPEAQQALRTLRRSQILQCEELLELGRESNANVEAIYPEGKSKKFSNGFSLSNFAPPICRVILSEYGMGAFRQDLVSALIIAIAGIPKAMSYAELAGLPVSAGIATLYVPCIVYAFLGGSRQIAISPQSVTCLLLAQMVSDVMDSSSLDGSIAERMKVTMLLTLFTGLAMIAFGALQLTFLLNFISKPVLSGFVSASAIIAAGSTLKSLLGVSVKKSPIAHVLISRVMEQMPNIHWSTAILSAMAIAIMVFMPRAQKAIAGRLEKRRNCIAKATLLVVKVPVVLYVVVLGVTVGGMLCDFESFTLWKAEHVILGRGATSVHQLHGMVRSEFECDRYDDRIIAQYDAVGSGDGIASVLTAAPVVDFAYTDKAPPLEDLAKHDVLMFPLASSIVCPVVNVPLLQGSHQITLVLDLPTVANIFSGEIRSWVDDRIRQLNPNLPWQHVETSTPINVIVRSDSSGTSKTFSEVLKTCDNCNSSALVPGLNVDWGAPLQMHATSNYDAVNAVAQTPWSIGYATLGEVMHVLDEKPDLSFHCAALRQNQTISTAEMAWIDLLPWPIIHKTHVLVPQVGTLRRPVGVARHDDACLARRSLLSYLDKTYASQDAGKALYLRMEPRPKELDNMLCKSDRKLLSVPDDGARQLLVPRRRLAAEGKCKAASPVCSDFKMVGYIETSLPAPELPTPATSIAFGTLATNALLLASVALLEHVANAKLYADRNDYEMGLASDIVAMGVSNVVGACFGSFVVAGGFSRSALNAKAVSQVSGLAAVAISFLVVWLASPLLSMLPTAILNVILFVAVIALVDWKLVVALAKLRRRGAVDLLQLIIAFMATCTLGVVQGMIIAIGFSIVLFIFHSAYPQIVELSRVRGTMYYDVTRDVEETSSCGFALARSSKGNCRTIHVMRFEAPMWFANMPRFSDHLLQTLKQGRGRIRGVVCEMASVPRMDTTAGMLFVKLLARSKELGASVVFANATAEVEAMLRSTCGLQQDSFYNSIYEAESYLEACIQALEEQTRVDVEEGDPSLESHPSQPDAKIKTLQSL
eukprot:TRINITY_DN22179_c0_g5_i2.p1 TRINITY_DN22179_c0_g5~~TRINITY_DN22179_c0_g5_i2.p1  ORF type:complete len:1271 (-),score=214.93 TRINITY_DN22179_c0_g5_i2:209-4021(-)